MGEDAQKLPLSADDVGRIIDAIEQSGKKKRIRLRTTLDFPFNEVWDIDRAIRACRRLRHDRPQRTLACWDCWRRAIRGRGESLLILVTRVRK